jgi:RND superfamily putative drug exporter
VRSLATICYERRRLVLLAWVLLLGGLIALNATIGGESRTEFNLPGSESQEAVELLREHGFESRTGDSAHVVFQAEQGIDDPVVREAIEGFLAAAAAAVEGTSFVSPYSDEGATQVSQDRKIAYAQLNFSERSVEEYTEMAGEVRDLRHEISVPGLQVELGGEMFAEFSEFSNELIGIAGAIVILLIAFGSLLAMGLPLVAALFGVGTGIALVGLAANFISMPNFTTQVAVMIGIGVGIDYALFIVTRYRQGLHEGRTPEDAVVTALDTAGRAVLFAGLTVVIALLGLIAMGLPMNTGVAIGSSLAVLMTMVASVTLLPAILGFVGRRIDRFSIPGYRREQRTEHSAWHRWSRLVQRYPWPMAVGALAVLLLLSVPVFTLRLGFGDAGNRGTHDTTRRAYDLLSEGFGPGFNGPFVVAAETPGGAADLEALRGLSATFNETEGVAFATPPFPNESGSAAIVTVYPTTSPQDEATTDLVHRLRDDVIPAGTEGTSLTVKVGGMAPAVTDFSEYTASRMPVFFAAVLGLSFLLLLVVFRSLLVPLKAVLMNLLSIGAAYGVIVAVFQWGWGASLIGVGKEGPVEAWAPMMLFAVVFGLSMDYEVFLLSRIKEEYDRTGDNAAAVADGLAATARVITAAAAIMVVVFASFVLGDDRALKLMGMGLAVAIFVDATIVRMVLVPATMELLGRWNWWLPAWLGRVIPVVHVEPPTVAHPPRPAGAK